MPTATTVGEDSGEGAREAGPGVAAGPEAADQARAAAWKDAAEPLTTVVIWIWGNAAAGILLVGAFLVVKGFVLSKGNIPVALGILQTAGLS